MWCTVLNAGLLILSFLICTFAADWVYGMHRRWYPIPREAFNIAIYCFIGLFKMGVITFNVVPYLALVIVG